MQLDTVQFNYLMEKLVNEEPKGFLSMINDQLADQFHSELIKSYPELIYIKEDIEQYFAIDKNGKEHLKDLFEKRKMKLEQDVKDTNATLKLIDEYESEVNTRKFVDVMVTAVERIEQSLTKEGPYNLDKVEVTRERYIEHQLKMTADFLKGIIEGFKVK